MSAKEYLSLVDWTGRQIVQGRGRAMPNQLPPLLLRVGIGSENWLLLVSSFGRLFQRVAGAPHTLARLRRPGRSARPDCSSSARQVEPPRLTQRPRAPQLFHHC
jgi:hypothetical protein